MKENDLEDVKAGKTDRGPGSAGQSGDLQGLEPDDATGLLEEGQSFAAGILSGIENAPMADDSEIETTEVAEDDVPLEYLDDEQGNES
ncbi:MAG: hypothetical protein WB676_20905 [Bryobacteraceae bacterium]